MNNRVNLIAALVLLLNIIIVWLPVQFQTTAIQEEWRIRALFDGHITTYGDSGNKTTDEIFETRPVIGVLNQLTYLLSPDSFISHHLILITTLFLKGFIVLLIFRRLLPDDRLLGYMSALLLVFYPSDPAIVSIRVIHTHLAIVFILLSIYSLIAYYQTSRWIFVGLMWMSQALAGLTIEIGYPLFFFTPLIILILEKRISRRFILLTILFYIVPAITFLYSFVLILFIKTSWQRTAIASYGIRDYVINTLNLYQYNFVSTWTNLINTIATNTTQSDQFVFVSTTAVTLVGGIFMMGKSGQQSINRKNLMKLSIVGSCGLIIVFLGYAMFLPSRTHVLTNYRVYLLSSIGVAIVIGTVIYGLHLAMNANLIMRYGALIGISILIGIASIFANTTHHQYLTISDLQEKLIRQITTDVPALNDDAYIVLKTESNTRYRSGNIGEIDKPVLFTPMLQYIYADYDQLQSGIICFTAYLECVFTPDGLMLEATNFTNVETPIDYSQLIIFDIDKDANLSLIVEDNSLSGYDPMRLINTDAPPPRRVQTLYGNPK